MLSALREVLAFRYLSNDGGSVFLNAFGKTFALLVLIATFHKDIRHGR